MTTTSLWAIFDFLKLTKVKSQFTSDKNTKFLTNSLQGISIQRNDELGWHDRSATSGKTKTKASQYRWELSQALQRTNRELLGRRPWKKTFLLQYQKRVEFLVHWRGNKMKWREICMFHVFYFQIDEAKQLFQVKAYCNFEQKYP